MNELDEHSHEIHPPLSFVIHNIYLKRWFLKNGWQTIW